jgi:hypothetical protein
MKKDIKVSLEQEIKKIKRWSDILEIGDNTIGVGDTSIPPGFRDSFGEEAEIRTGTDLGATDQMTGYMDMGEGDDSDEPTEIEKVLHQIQNDCNTAQKIVDVESVKVMTVVLDELVKEPNLARTNEKKIESLHDKLGERCSKYDDIIDNFHEKYGYDNTEVDSIDTYKVKLDDLQADLYDISNLWYKLNQLVESIIYVYENNPKRIKTLLNIKTTDI